MKGHLQNAAVHDECNAELNNYVTTLADFVLSVSESSAEVVLSHPRSDGNVIMLIASKDGQVASMQMLPAGKVVTVIDTSELNSGCYLLMLQSSYDRRIFEFYRC
jgi:hypothetical protein